MTSNRVVTYIDIGLSSVDAYWEELVAPSVKAFRNEASSRTVFLAAHSVWHLHDWVWHERNPGKDSHGVAFSSYRNRLLDACPELGWLRDVADAGKHRGLGRLPEVKDAEPRRVMPPHVIGGGIIVGSALKFFLVLNDGSQQDVEHILRAAIIFWRNDLERNNLPSPFA